MMLVKGAFMASDICQHLPGGTEENDGKSQVLAEDRRRYLIQVHSVTAAVTRLVVSPPACQSIISPVDGCILYAYRGSNCCCIGGAWRLPDLTVARGRTSDLRRASLRSM